MIDSPVTDTSTESGADRTSSSTGTALPVTGRAGWTAGSVALATGGVLATIAGLALAIGPIAQRYYGSAFLDPDTSYAGLVLIGSIVWGFAIVLANDDRRGKASRSDSTAEANPPGGTRTPVTGDVPPGAPGSDPACSPPSALPAWLGVGAAVLLNLSGKVLLIFLLRVLALWCLFHALIDLGSRGRWRHVLAPVRWFSLLAVPVPASVVIATTGTLKHWVARATGAVLGHLGIPSVVQGISIVTPWVTVEVVPACSGFRSLVVLGALAVALLLHHRLRPVRAAALLATTPLIAGVGNICRILFHVACVRFGLPLVEGTGHLLAGLIADLPGMIVLLTLAELLATARDTAGPRTGR